MKIENPGVEGAIVELRPLDHLMGKHGFIRAGQWDYERVTYDFKIGSTEKNITYYIRIMGYAVEGDVDHRNAIIKLMTPLLGKHYYPHGIEYGPDEEFPTSLVDRAHALIDKIQEEIELYKAQV